MSTLTLTKPIETFELRVDLAIPPHNPQIRGHLTVGVKTMSRPAFNDLMDQGLSDEELFDELVASVKGLGNESGELEGPAAITECKEGLYSMYLVTAIVQAVITQYGEARQGNSRKRR